MQKNYNKKQTINSYIKVLDQFDTNFPFSPKKKKKVEIHLKKIYQRKV